MKSKLDALTLTLAVIAGLLAIALLASCETPKNTPENALPPASAASNVVPDKIPPPTEPEAYKLSWNNAEWSNFAVGKIKAEYYSRLTQAQDLETFCPRYHDLPPHHQAFVLGELLSAMAKFESAWKPETTYTEAFADRHGKRVVSRGLLQLSIESAQGYKCPITKAQALHDPKTNIDCGLRILSRVIERTGRIGAAGPKQYWAVIKPDSTHHKLPAIRAMVAKVPGCLPTPNQ